MYWSRQRLKEMAKTALRGSYWKCVFVSLIVILISGGLFGGNFHLEIRYDSVTGAAQHIAWFRWFSSRGAIIVLFVLLGMVVTYALLCAMAILLFLPAEVGCKAFFISDLYAPTDVRRVGTGFRADYWNIVKVQFRRILYILLWSLLLIVPGIIKAYEYRLVPYLLAENPAMDRKECLARSKAMMDGEKWNTFLLDLSFVGWGLLGLLTLGVLNVFYVEPYYQLTTAALYCALKRKAALTASAGTAGTPAGDLSAAPKTGETAAEPAETAETVTESAEPAAENAGAAESAEAAAGVFEGAPVPDSVFRTDPVAGTAGPDEAAEEEAWKSPSPAPWDTSWTAGPGEAESGGTEETALDETDAAPEDGPVDAPWALYEQTFQASPADDGAAETEEPSAPAAEAASATEEPAAADYAGEEPSAEPSAEGWAAEEPSAFAEEPSVYSEESPAYTEEPFEHLSGTAGEAGQPGSGFDGTADPSEDDGNANPFEQ